MDKVTNVIYFFLVLVQIGHGQVIRPGKCPKVDGMSGFQLKPYMGIWYEVSKFTDHFEDKQRCIQVEYSIDPNSHIHVKNIGIIHQNDTVIAEGYGFVPDPSKPAKLMVSFSHGAPPVAYTIVDTDYRNYAVAFSCSDIFGVANTQFAWIYSRNRTMDQTIIQSLKDKQTEIGIDVNNFEDTIQMECDI